MIIPNFENIRIVDRNGYLTPEWQLILQQLFSALQTNVSEEGFVIPKKSTVDIAKIASQFATTQNPADYFGDLLYDSTTDQLKVNLAGTFHVIVTV